MSLAILFHFLCAQHVLDINISIFRRLRLFYCITTLVVLFLFRCVLEWAVRYRVCKEHSTALNVLFSRELYLEVCRQY